jgi:molecular chaperone GrpE
MDKNTQKQQDETENEDNQKENVEQTVEQTKIEELERKVEESEAKYKRAIADYQNLEKWMREQRSEWIQSANKDLLLRLLPVLDTLLLAQLHSKDQTLQVTVTHFMDILKAEGVTKIETMGKDFDPHLMEAITTAEGKENKVVEELRPGFRLHEKVLRPAQVIVGQGE